MKRARTSLVWIATGITAFVFALGTPGRGTPGTPEPVLLLSQTGLYSDARAVKVDPENIAYSPQYPSWADGSEQRRWIYIPPGDYIDASDPDVWTFPLGTKAWKEFSFNGRRVETRMLESLGRMGWRIAVYLWDADGRDARLASPQGLQDVVEIKPGVTHDIPSVQDCQACHVSGRFEILGFSALQLSEDRDREAPHAEAKSRSMISLRSLIQKGVIRSYPDSWTAEPPRVDRVDPTGRAALGYLHSNCGNCHNARGSGDALSVVFRHSLNSGGDMDLAIQTGLNRAGRFLIPGVPPGESMIIKSGDPEHSILYYRMASRDPYRQMPPVGTKLIDQEALGVIKQWITGDLVARVERMDRPPAKTGGKP